MSNASCPLANGQCAKEQTSQSHTHDYEGRVDADEPLIRFLRVNEMRKNQSDSVAHKLKSSFLRSREIFEGTDNGWSFLRERMISDNVDWRELAIKIRGKNQPVYGYVRTCARELKALAAQVLADMLVPDNDKALGVIHDGAFDLPEHVSVENCIPLSEEQVKGLCEHLAGNLKAIHRI